MANPIFADQLRRGDVFTTHQFKGEWMVCLAKPTKQLADLKNPKSGFWEVLVCGWDVERRALTHGGPYVGVPLRAHVFLSLDWGGTACAQLAYRDRRAERLTTREEKVG